MAIPPLMVLLRLVHEGTATRIRHRALLDVLAAGPYDFDAYRRRYVELLERDREALVAKTMLTAEDFKSLFEDWLKEDEARYALPLSAPKTNRRLRHVRNPAEKPRTQK